MKNRGTKALLAAMLVIATIGTATAKNLVTGTVNGKRYKWKGRYVIISAGRSGVILAASKPARPGGIVRTIGFGCPVSLTGVMFPLTPDPANCNASYQETRVSRTPSPKAWTALSDVQVTYSSFDGTRLTGTFAATLLPLLGNPSPPVSIQGQFQGKVSAGR